MWAVMLEFIQKTEDLVHNGIRRVESSYMLENVELKSVVSCPKRVGCENLQCDVLL